MSGANRGTVEENNESILLEREAYWIKQTLEGGVAHTTLGGKLLR